MNGNFEEAHAADSSSLTEIRAALDAKCKKLLARKQVIANIMHGCLKEFKDIPPSDIERDYIIDAPIVGTAPVMPASSAIIGPAEDASAAEGSVFFDVKCTARTPSSGGNVGMIINIESQGKFKPGYWLPTRGIYYVCRMISSEYGVFLINSDYGGLVQAASIWICTNPLKEFRNTVTTFSVKPENNFGGAEYPRECYDLMTVIMVCLGEAPDDDTNTPYVVKLLRGLTDARMTREEKEHYLRRECPDFAIDNEMKGDFDNMCSYSQGIYDNGRAEGRLEGRAEGRLEGRAEGRLEGRAEGRLEGRAGAFCDLVQQNIITPLIAAQQLKMSEADFSRTFEVYRKGLQH